MAPTTNSAVITWPPGEPADSSTKVAGSLGYSAGVMSDSTPEKSSMMPAIAAGAVFLVVAAIVLWPDANSKDGAPSTEAAAEAGADPSNPASAKGSTRAGGVGARDFEPAKGAPRKPRMNPAAAPPASGFSPQAPAPKQPDPESFESEDAEREWIEGALAKARTEQEQRQKFAERLPKAKERAENSRDPQAGLAAYETRAATVQANLERANTRVAELEARLARLGGEPAAAAGATPE